MRIRHARLRGFRRTGLSALAVIGSCLGVYAVLAIAFHALVEPSLGMSIAASKTPPAVAVLPAPDTASPAIVAAPPAATPRRAAVAVAAASDPKARNTTANAGGEIAAEAKSAARPASSATRHYHSARNRWNSFGFLFGASFGHRRWF